MESGKKMKGLVLLGGVLVISLSIIFPVLHQFDVRGLTGRAADRARANDFGGIGSVALELSQGEFEFRMHHFQNGELVDSQYFYDQEGDQVTPMKVERREVLTIGFGAPSEQGMNFFLSTEITVEDDTMFIEHTEIATFPVYEATGLAWEQVESRMQLGEDERGVAGWILGTTQFFPSGIEQTFKESFEMSENLNFFASHDDVFLLTIRKIAE